MRKREYLLSNPSEKFGIMEGQGHGHISIYVEYEIQQVVWYWKERPLGASEVLYLVCSGESPSEETDGIRLTPEKKNTDVVRHERHVGRSDGVNTKKKKRYKRKDMIINY